MNGVLKNVEDARIDTLCSVEAEVPRHLRRAVHCRAPARYLASGPCGQCRRIQPVWQLTPEIHAGTGYHPGLQSHRLQPGASLGVSRLCLPFSVRGGYQFT